PESFAHLLRALDFALEPTREVALVGGVRAGDGASADGGAAAGGGGADLAAVLRSEFRPRLALPAGPEGSGAAALPAGRATVAGKPAAYVCQNFTCQLPVTNPAALLAALGESNHL